VFIYAAEVPHSFPKLLDLLHRMDQGELASVTNILTLAEVLVVPIRDGDIKLQNAYKDRIRNSRSLTVVDISRDILIKAAELRATTKGVKLPDAIHACTCMISACHYYLTNDVRLKSVFGLPVVTLGELA
jgi:predicted nucleic acid-binding protein